MKIFINEYPSVLTASRYHGAIATTDIWHLYKLAKRAGVIVSASASVNFIAA